MKMIFVGAQRLEHGAVPPLPLVSGHIFGSLNAYLAAVENPRS